MGGWEDKRGKRIEAKRKGVMEGGKEVEREKKIEDGREGEREREKQGE